jgi:glycosyltransferase involved in cell wall biosynthesis
VPDNITLGIDASNIRAGGGLTHLGCLLAAIKPDKYDIGRIIVWGGQQTVKRLPQRAEIQLVRVPLLDGPLPLRIAWQSWLLPRHLNERKCDVLFSPGGILPVHVHIPSVVMFQNLLPFEPQEAQRFGTLSFMRLKMRLVGASQRRSMEQADGLIFLTSYARDTVTATLKCRLARIAVIPHGIETRFFRQPRLVRFESIFTKEMPFRMLYVSIVDMYKHQWYVAEAIATLRGEGLPVEIDFVGPAYGPALKRLNVVIKRLDPAGEFLHYRGAIPFPELHTAYLQADAFVFASSCENLPNILLEAMAAGLPIACSRKGPMLEVLGEAGIYFDPEKPREIEAALRTLIEQPAMRNQLALDAHRKAKDFSWERCAEETFSFMAQVAQDPSHSSRLF